MRPGEFVGGAGTKPWPSGAVVNGPLRVTVDGVAVESAILQVRQESKESQGGTELGVSRKCNIITIRD